MNSHYSLLGDYEISSEMVDLALLISSELFDELESRNRACGLNDNFYENTEPRREIEIGPG